MIGGGARDGMDSAPHDSRTPFIPVLLYHSVSDRPPVGVQRFTLSERNFADHIEMLARHRASGATPMLMRDLAEALRGPAELPARAFAVTFDDGYADNAAALQALADAGIPSTLYVTVEFVGRPGMLDAAEVRALARHPMIEIGAHSVRHRRLDELSRQEIAGELHGCRTFLQEITDTPVESVAYPYGNHDQRVLEEVAAAGYTSGAAVKNVLSRPGDDPLAIARWTVMDDCTRERLAGVLGGEVPVVAPRERLVTRSYRIARQARRRSIRLVLGSGAQVATTLPDTSRRAGT
jgi:peptidoglycan/xylan/chitin deacetylase (PgdA/CDA1 family)